MSSVQVAVRARPLSQREIAAGTAFCIEMREKSVVLYKSGKRSDRSSTHSSAKEFGFDHSYWSANKNDEHFVDQERVFRDLGVPVLESAFQGYNVCVFAYGQTGSGKTHTMMGSEDALGLIPRICEGLFGWMSREKVESGEKVSYKNEVSYMEIYNEKVRDLLRPTPARDQQLHSLRVREHPKEGPYVEDLSRHAVSDYAGISHLIEIGNSHRATASTLMNSTSSRSHAIFTIKFTQAKYQFGLPSETVSKIHLVDLAGSERASATGAEGERLKEGGNINRSLVCLGTVISALADMSSNRGKKLFIPYRDSVLTWLLKDSLGGNSKTIMVATISPAETSYGETLSTLRYASRAKNIVNEPTVNEDQNVKLIRELRAEIQRLKTVIQTSGNVDPLPEGNPRLRSTSISLVEDIHKKEEQVAELTRKWAGKWTDIRRIVEEHHLALRSEGVKMVVDSMQPHFVGVDPDILSTGLVFYYLKDGSTTIGARSSDDNLPDISVAGTDIDAEHCRVECKGHQVVLHPLRGECFLNHALIREPVLLSQGDLLQLGESSVLRFNHPHEAQKLRKKHHESASSPNLSEKAHTLPRRKKKNSPRQSSSHYLIDNVGSVSPSVTKCTMKVELESTSRVSAHRKRRTQSGLTVTPTRSHESEAEGVFSEGLFSPTLSDFSHSSDTFFSSSTSSCSQLAWGSDLESSFPTGTTVTTTAAMRPRPCHSHLTCESPHRPISGSRLPPTVSGVGLFSSLTVWLVAPVLICVAAVLTLPVGLLLALLLFFMRLFGVARQSFLVRCLSMPLAFLASLTLSPLAVISEMLFQRTLNFLTFIQTEQASSLRYCKGEGG